MREPFCEVGCEVPGERGDCEGQMREVFAQPQAELDLRLGKGHVKAAFRTMR